jgi:pantetheine-phosphate adenylyltransferase
MNRIAYYPGSFDPMTNGHMDVLQQAVALADEIIIGIGVHPGKVPLFSFEERAEIIKSVTSGMNANITVQSFDNLVVDAAAKAGASILIRGVRDGTDLDYEMQMSGMNGTMRPEITTVILPSKPETRHITATLVRQIAKMGGDVSPFVPDGVNTALKSKLAS